MKYLPKIIQYFLALVLVLSFIGKIQDLSNFELQVKTIFIISAESIGYSKADTKVIVENGALIFELITLAVLFAELLLALLLWLNLYTRSALLLLIALFGLFSLSTAILLSNPASEFLTCGCFGKLWEESLSGWALVRNALLIAMAVYVYRYSPKVVEIDKSDSPFRMRERF
ncbi:MAG: hypothetical protein SFU91_03545 [Chloroherpetonaceae bacterium]|nr:hypothetical protein [Chloroherpetonaceae bacterium]